ncbi:hypothetical protein BJV82DRAFT_578181 [Fennellomyces sp. T-0311]|nr:hypothetical protein BJV82DRAFT_578181 [Fennellomyces sp. T-0311]
MNPELRRDTIVEVPSRHYQHQVMQNWFTDKENRNLQKANMQVIYDMIAPNTPNTPSFLEFTAYVVTTSLVHESHFHHTKHRQILHSARDSFQTQLINEICGMTPPTTPGFSKKLVRHALLIFIDEFHPSPHCSQGGEELQELHVERSVGDHNALRFVLPL